MKISVKVIPGASKDQIVEIRGGAGNKSFKIKTSKPPENGKANQAVIEILATHFQIKKSQIKILSGLVSAKKIIEILEY